MTAAAQIAQSSPEERDRERDHDNDMIPMRRPQPVLASFPLLFVPSSPYPLNTEHLLPQLGLLRLLNAIHEEHLRMKGTSGTSLRRNIGTISRTGLGKPELADRRQEEYMLKPEANGKDRRVT